MTSSTVSREEVELFLTETKFSGYQSVPLPHGLSVPGIDRQTRVQQVLPRDVKGKSVLDVGTNYGIVPYSAIQRGASKAVGLEPDEQYYPVARRIAELNGNRYEVRQQRVEELSPDEHFDVVLFLNVLHHIVNPVSAVARLVAVCRETMVIEFSLPDDPEYLVYLYDQRAAPSYFSWLRARARSATLRALTARLPLMAVGNRTYDRTFYFSPQAFDNLFRVHLGFFDTVTFSASHGPQRRMVAVCRVAAGAADNARSHF